MNRIYTNLIASTIPIVMVMAPYAVTDRIDYSLVDVSRTNHEPLKESKITDPSARIMSTSTAVYAISASTTPIAGTSMPPRTELGRKFLEFRNKAILEGMVLLNIDEVNLRVEELRGKEA